MTHFKIHIDWVHSLCVNLMNIELFEITRGLLENIKLKIIENIVYKVIIIIIDTINIHEK
mgnify:CR=1 FL=1